MTAPAITLSLFGNTISPKDRFEAVDTPHGGIDTTLSISHPEET
jgi:hypothetical protein